MKAMAQPDARQRRGQDPDKVSKAWSLYLASTKYLSSDRYEETEPRAWRRLLRNLREAQEASP